jgi:phosphatidylinositol glycan class W
MWIDLTFPAPWVPRVFESLNRNQLALFLFANLATGLINMSIDTLSLTETPSLIILGLYMETVAYAAVKLRTVRLFQFK